MSIQKNARIREELILSLEDKELILGLEDPGDRRRAPNDF
jgi:hypothetical protein